MRTAASTVLGWQVGIAAEPLQELTFFSALEKADLLGVANIEGSSTQKVNLEIPKYLTCNRAPGEITAVKDRLNVMSIRMAAYRVPTIGPGEEAGRKLFEFAKAIGEEFGELAFEELGIGDQLRTPTAGRDRFEIGLDVVHIAGERAADPQAGSTRAAPETLPLRGKASSGSVGSRTASCGLGPSG